MSTPNEDKMLTIEEINEYTDGHHLTRMQSRIAGTCLELLAEREDLKATIASLNKRLTGVQEYQQRANVKPTVLVVQDLGRHGAITVYGNPDLVATKRLVVYPWTTDIAEICRLGKPWVDCPMLEYLESPYAGEFSVAKAMELESKRATIEGCEAVAKLKDSHESMKKAVSDCVGLLSRLESLKEKSDE